VPPLFRPRVQLALAIVNGDLAAISRHLSSVPVDLHSEQLECALLLSEASLVYGFSIQSSWVGTFWEQQLLAKGLGAELAALLAGTQTTIDLQGRNWRDQSKLLFLSALTRARVGQPSLAQESYVQLESLLVQRRLSPPLIPAMFLSPLQQLSSPWGTALAKLLGQEPRPLVDDTKATLRVDEATGQLHFEGVSKLSKTFSLAKSPTTLRLASILARLASGRVSKRELHKQLTACRYVPDLHDSRLHKLLKRFEQRLQQELGDLKVFQWPGDNSIRILLEFRT
jgi:hypothetical protein